jgi:hypothetical protein
VPQSELSYNILYAGPMSGPRLSSGAYLPGADGVRGAASTGRHGDRESRSTPRRWIAAPRPSAGGAPMLWPSTPSNGALGGMIPFSKEPGRALRSATGPPHAGHSGITWSGGHAGKARARTDLLRAPYPAGPASAIGWIFNNRVTSWSRSQSSTASARARVCA